MAWIESHQEVGRHPKTKKLARRLGVSLPAAVGHLHYLWWWALDFAQDGTLDKYDNDDIAEAMEWNGDGDELMEALQEAGFIDRTEYGGLMIHDWGIYAGKLIERRAKDRDRKRKAAEAVGVPETFRRSSDGIDAEGEKNLKENFVTQPTVPNPTNQTVPNSTEPYPTNPKSSEPSLQERRFAEFWEEYPKKVGKKAAQTSWNKIKPDTELFERIITAVTAAKVSDQWIKEGGRYIPNPATWLNQGRWDDELPLSPTIPQQPRGNPGKPNTRAILESIIAEEGGGLY